VVLKISLKKIIQDIINKDLENKKQLLKKEVSSGDISLKPLAFSK
jgi:hypothetical protein